MPDSSKLYPIVVTTTDLAILRDHYRTLLGWDVTFDQPGYLQVRSGSDASDPELAFMPPELEGAGAIAPFTGGLIVSVPVADADAHHAAVTAAGAASHGAPTDKPWGWRSHVVVDPAGVMVDFFHELTQAGG